MPSIHAESSPVAEPTHLQRIAGGVDGALKDCIDAYGKAVWSLALRLSPTYADAEDATQEIFLDLWRSGHRFDPDRGSELGFILTIARRRLIDRIRRANARPSTESEDLLPAADVLVSADASPELSAEVDLAMRALDVLTAEQRRVIAMSVVKGLTHREIATLTGKPLGTVKTLIRRGLIRIRGDLGDVGLPAQAGAGGRL